MCSTLIHFIYKNTKTQKSNESLPSHFSASPYYSTSLSVPRCPQTAFYYVPFHHLGYPILPIRVSHFAIWGIPFHLLGYPILPFGMSHFTIWSIPFAIWDVPFHHLGYPILPFVVSHFTICGIPFRHLRCPISPFGMSHFAIWGIPFYLLGYPILPFGVYFRHICAQCTAPMHDLPSSFFRCLSLCLFLSFRFIMFLRISLGWIKYIL